MRVRVRVRIRVRVREPPIYPSGFLRRRRLAVATGATSATLS